jgi:hypothetical protein
MIDIKHNNYYRKVGAEMHDKLSAQVDTDHFVGWGKFGMSELAEEFPVAPGGHPLAQGHEKIANEIYIRL